MAAEKFAPARGAGGLAPVDSMGSELGGAAKEMFDEIDADGSGTIDCAEIRSGFSKLGISYNQDEWRLVTQMLDNDGDGVVSQAEFLMLFTTPIDTLRNMTSIRVTASSAGDPTAPLSLAAVRQRLATTSEELRTPETFGTGLLDVAEHAAETVGRREFWIDD